MLRIDLPPVFTFLKCFFVLILVLPWTLATAQPSRSSDTNGVMAAQAQQLEARAKHITSELRCLVCQNQTIADSNAELAQDLRREVRTLLSQGRSDEQIVDYMTQRYGDFVRYRPPLKSTTWLLWGAPMLLLVGGFVVLTWVLRRRSRLGDEQFEIDEFDESSPAQELSR